MPGGQLVHDAQRDLRIERLREQVDREHPREIARRGVVRESIEHDVEHEILLERELHLPHAQLRVAVVRAVVEAGRELDERVAELAPLLELVPAPVGRLGEPVADLAVEPLRAGVARRTFEHQRRELQRLARLALVVQILGLAHRLAIRVGERRLRRRAVGIELHGVDDRREALGNFAARDEALALGQPLVRLLLARLLQLHAGLAVLGVDLLRLRVRRGGLVPHAALGELVSPGDRLRISAAAARYDERQQERGD